MFELSVAWKYLLPRRRQLSVSIISLISIAVIALVVWLVVLFFSITNGMERHWISKLIAVTAPVRMTPTQAYYDSYYYQVDGLSANANYGHKSLGQKRKSVVTDSYDPYQDEEVPVQWPAPLLDGDGELRDLVKETFAAVEGLRPQFAGLRAVDYEAAFGNVRLRLLRDTRPQADLDIDRDRDTDNQRVLAQAAIFGSLDPEQPALPAALLPLRASDVNNVLYLLGMGTANNRDDGPLVANQNVSADGQARLRSFFHQVTVVSLRVPEKGWQVPRALLPKQATWQVVVVESQGGQRQLVIPARSSDLPALTAAIKRDTGLTAEPATLRIKESQLALINVKGDEIALPIGTRVILPGGVTFTAQLDGDSLASAVRPQDVQFHITAAIQGTTLTGKVRYQGLAVDKFLTTTTWAEAPAESPPWMHQVANKLVLPAQSSVGEAVLLPKAFLDVGVFVGDRGYLSYQAPSVSTMQEQRVPIYVAGFYDPGIIPIGGKFVLVNGSLTSLIRSAYEQQDSALTNGINVSFSDFRQADKVKQAIQQKLQQQGLDRYWKVETFRQYDFTKELLQQLGSDKNLSMVIACVIILVACSNIVSMLIILVNDKKQEIGILRSMGATSRSIALIFGLCGVVMGLIGGLLGAGAAMLTLRYLDGLIRFMESIQGYEIFNPTFYGNTMPNEVSWEGLAFVLLTTTLISILAGIVPAIKASMLKPASILRAE